MDKPVYFIGGGGHAVSVLNVARETGREPAGYVDVAEHGSMALPYSGSDSGFMALVAPEDAEVHITVVAGAGCDMSLRRKLIDRYSAYPAATYVAASAVVVAGSAIGDGSAVMHGAVINGAVTGRHCVVNTGAVVEHGCKLGDNVFVGPGAVICGGVEIGPDVFIGAGATVRNGVSICSGASVAMGAAVIHSIEQPGIYVGVPARKLDMA